MIRKPLKGEIRTPEQLRRDYALEKELAARLRNASRQDRKRLYAEVYDEFYQRATRTRQLVRKSSPGLTAASVAKQMSLLRRYLNRDTTFLEIAPGDCALSVEVAKHVKHVYMVDVSAEITQGASLPANCELMISDGTSIPVPPNRVTVAFSNQFMEHLHPDDAREQLQNVHECLTAGGHYVCVTPNRLSGPHDISKYFDTEATGFHLKEYTVTELLALFETVGFSHHRSFVGKKQIYVRVPIAFQRSLEALIGLLPNAARRTLVRPPFSGLLGIRLVGRK